MTGFIGDRHVMWSRQPQIDTDFAVRHKDLRDGDEKSSPHKHHHGEKELLTIRSNPTGIA
jgi:hypothetical protein